ncbi:MAG: hypothetical protein JST39_11140, partial [Bacteroidetes bacterium]|nr:hypothetical protein [Bacteroidota bacterium]
MRTAQSFAFGLCLILTAYKSAAQQLRLGSTPYSTEKSAVLELQSDRQGLLLSRLSDTSIINTLTPPDGMLIYFRPLNQAMIRANGRWQTLLTTIDTSSINNFSQKTRSLFSAAAPLSYNSATGQFGITQATATTNGYLSSADWNAFNNKAAAFTTGNLTETGSGILTITGGANAVTGSGTTIQVKQASASQNGFLSSADWSAFNNKLSTVDTSNIANFYLKVRSEHSAAAPLTYNNTTGQYGITQASSTTNGYLSSTDWNTFNNKAGSFSTGNFTETGSSVLTITG